MLLKAHRVRSVHALLVGYLMLVGCGQADPKFSGLPAGSLAVVVPNPEDDGKGGTPRDFTAADTKAAGGGLGLIFLNAGCMTRVLEDGAAPYRDEDKERLERKKPDRLVRVKVQDGRDEGHIALIWRSELRPAAAEK